MTTPEQIEFIRHQLAAGASRADITKALAATGWALPDIDEAFAKFIPRPVPPPVPAMPHPSPTPVVAPMPTAVPAHAPVTQDQTQPLYMAPGTRHFSTWMVVAGVLIGMAGAGIVYAYLEKLGPFAQAPYTEDNLLSGLLASSAKITSSSYALTGTLAVGPRDADAVPFTMKVSNEAQLVEQYKNDATRASDVSYLLAALQYEKTPYPTTLQKVAANTAARNTFHSKLSYTDPVSGQAYGYVVTEGGRNFSLTATFETTAAVSAVRGSFQFSTTTTFINGQAITFTNGSRGLFLSSEPPKPFLVSLGEMMQYLPAEIALSYSIAAASDWSKVDAADWKFNVDATGDFGDLSFKVDADALKKDKDYYFRINNIPSLLGDFSSIKGQWVKVSPTAASSSAVSDSSSEFASLASQLPEIEQNYKKDKAEALDAIKRISAFADEEHLFVFRNPPKSEKVDGRSLYRYDLRFNKDAILPFYKKMAAEAATNSFMRDLALFNDPGMIDYLQSDEFSKTFDYLDKNTTITLWVDQAGFPAIQTYTMRIVPPDTATPLIKKQINVSWKLTTSDINKPVNIVAPEGAKPIEDILSGAGDSIIGASLAAARVKSNDATIQSDLNTIQTQAEIYYGGAGRNSYGSQKWVSGSSMFCTGGMFKDANITKALGAADTANGDGKNVMCYANPTEYMIGSELASSGWWCIDSTGAAKRETGTLPTVEPKSKTCP